MKYHHRRAERLRNKLRKLEQYKSRRNRNTVTKQTSHQKTQSPARKKTVNKDDNVNELAEELKTKIGEFDVLLKQMRSQVCANKQSESYSCLLSDSLEVRGKGKANRRDNKAAKTTKEKSGEKSKRKSAFVTPSRVKYLHGIPWNSMEIHGNLWKSMEFHVKPWKSMEFHGTSMEYPWSIHGVPWNAIEFHGVSTEFHGMPWSSMEYPWSSMECHGVPRSSMK